MSSILHSYRRLNFHSKARQNKNRQSGGFYVFQTSHVALPDPAVASVASMILDALGRFKVSGTFQVRTKTLEAFGLSVDGDGLGPVHDCGRCIASSAMCGHVIVHLALKDAVWTVDHAD